MTSKNNFVWVDFARSIGSFSVIALHLSAVIVVTFAELGTGHWWFANIIDSSTRWAVPVFVMISGFLLLNPKKQEHLNVFFKKRFSKVGIPLVAWSAIFFWWGYYFYKIPVSNEIVLQKMIYGMPYFHLYFLFLIVGLYIITPILKIYLIQADNANIKYFLAISFGLPLLFTFFNHWYPTGAVGVNAFTFFFHYIGYFVSGYYLRNVKLSGIRLLIASLSLVMVITFTAIATYFTVKNFAPEPQWQYFYEYSSPNVLIMSILIFVIFKSLNDYIEKVPFLPKALGIVAPTTFGIYLIHPIIDNILQSGKLGFSINLFTPNPFVGSIYTIVSVFIFSFIITYIGRKIPIIKTIFG